MGYGRTNLALGPINVLANRVRPIIMGVKRQISSSATAWERTDGSIGMVANATHDGTAVQNDFDTAPIYADILTMDISANGNINRKYGDADFSFTNPVGYIVTYFPEFWYKRWQADGWEYIQISNVEQEGFEYSEPFYIGRYTTGGNSSAVTCKSGVSSFVNISITNLRTYSKNVGAGWGLMDIWRWSMLQLLYLVEYADYNSQAKLGYGNCSTSAQINNGGCDSLGMKSGCLANAKATAVIYRGVENPFGNIWQWLDGINIGTGRKSWVCKDRSQYASDKTSSPYIQMSYAEPSSYSYIKTMGYDANNPAIQRATATGGSDSTYCPDYFGSNAGYCVYVGGDWGHGLYCGLWCANCSGSSYASASIGGRLLFIPV